MRIKSAAIKHLGKIYIGLSHSEIGLQMVSDGVCVRYPSGDTQGFVTDEDTFVSREEARKIAEESGQVTKFMHSYLLFSEDLR